MIAIIHDTLRLCRPIAILSVWMGIFTTYAAHSVAQGQPPKEMHPLAADAIQRLPVETEVLFVSQGRREIYSSTTDISKAEKDRARVIDARLYELTLSPLLRLCQGTNTSPHSFRMIWCAEAFGFSKRPPYTTEDDRDSIFVYLFEVADRDSARVIGDALRLQSDVTTKELEGLTFGMRQIRTPARKSTNHYFWSPRPGVLVVARQHSLPVEQLRRWKLPRPETTPFPWTMPEWQAWNPKATTWGLRIANEHIRKESGLTGVVMTMDPATDPDGAQFTWPGHWTKETPGSGETAALYQFPYPDSFGQEEATMQDVLKQLESKSGRISVRCSFETVAKLPDVPKEHILLLVGISLGNPFGRCAPIGL